MAKPPDARHECTADDPWSPSKGKRARHRDAAFMRSLSEPERDVFQCPHCGLQFVEEVPV